LVIFADTNSEGTTNIVSTLAVDTTIHLNITTAVLATIMAIPFVGNTLVVVDFDILVANTLVAIGS
jgi:uncharacterized membrane protein